MNEEYTSFYLIECEVFKITKWENKTQNKTTK